MTFLASNIMDGARMYLNDTAASLYTNTAMIPYVASANRDLELILLEVGVEVQRQQSAAIVVAAGAVFVTLPTDFLLPINLHERASGVTTDPWIPMFEQKWLPADYVQGTSLTYWAFYNNAINLCGATTARDVLLQYERQLAIITGPNSPEDFLLSQQFLQARTAELCARYVGMNSNFADEIAGRETQPSKDRLESILVGNMQANPQRRRRFNTHNGAIAIKR